MIEVSDKDGLSTMVKTGLSFSFGSLVLIIVWSFNIRKLTAGIYLGPIYATGDEF